MRTETLGLRLTTRFHLAWVIGVATVVHTAVLWPLAVYQWGTWLALGVMGVGMAAVGVRQAVSVWLALLMLGMGSTGWRAHEHRAQVLPAAWEGVTLVLQGTIDDLPHATPQGWRLTLAVTQLALPPVPPPQPKPRSTATPPPPHTPLPVLQRVALFWPTTPDTHAPMPRAGEVWRLSVRLRQPHGLHNPGGRDPELWWWTQDIGATGTIRVNRDDPAPQRVHTASLWQVVVWRERVRSAIEATVPDTRLAGVLTGLVVGDQQAIDRTDWEVFRATGVAHLMSISGLHITLWAWLAMRLIHRLWRIAPWVAPVWGSRLLLALPAPVAAAWGGLLSATLYAVCSGWGVPAQRTIGMLALVVVLRLHGRFWPWPTVAVATMAVVLLWEPWAWMQPGFWLSFVAVMVLMATDARAHATPLPFAGAGDSGASPSVWRRGAQAVWRLLREQSIMTVALAPLTLLCFGQVSVVSWVANLIAVPWVTLVVTPLGLAGLWWTECWTVAAWALAQLQVWLMFWAAQPWAVWHAPQAPWPYAVAAVLGGCAAVMPGLAWPWRGLGALLLSPLLVWQAPRPPMGEFEVIAADVGQGSAVLIRTTNGSVLYDTGPSWSTDNDAGQRVVLPLLHHLGERPSRLVLSHSDSDHVGGAASVLGALYASSVYKNVENIKKKASVRVAETADVSEPHRAESIEHSRTADVYASFEPQVIGASGLVSASALRWWRCQDGQSWTQDGVRFDILHPSPARYERHPPLPTNDMSCVLWVRGRSGSVLLTGDLSARWETELIQAHPELHATVLLAPHHGSHSSSSMALLQTLRPQWVFIQAGHHNRYQHPSAQVMARYHSLGLRTHATPSCGAIRWYSNTTEVSCHRQDVQHHWHWQAPSSLSVSPLPDG